MDSISGTTVINLGLATIFNFGVAILPFWYVSDNGSLSDRLVYTISDIDVSLNMYPDIMLRVFIFPAIAGLVSMLALIIIFFTKKNYRISRNVVGAPIIVVLCILFYEVIVMKAIHIIGISLLALVPAWLYVREND